MKNAVEQFNALQDKILTRKEIQKLIDLADSQRQTDVENRLDAILINNPDTEEFKINITSKAKWVVPGGNDKKVVTAGLNATSKQKEEVLDSTKKVNKLKGKRNRTKKNSTTRKKIQTKLDVAENELKELKALYGLGASPSELFGLSYLPFKETASHGLGKPVSPDDIYQYVTNLIINTIHKDGLLPWQREWKKTGLSNGKEATNYESKKGYRGINFFLLNFEVLRDKKGEGYLTVKNWKNPYFLTFNQIEKYKGKLKKGSTGHRVVYFTKLYGHSENKADGTKLEFYSYSKSKFVTWINKNKSKLSILKRSGWNVKRLSNSYFPILKYYNIFNAEDITGIKWDKIPVNPNAAKLEAQKMEIAEDIVDNYPNPPHISFTGDQPMYIPSSDTVVQTPIQDFNNVQSYYSTFFHELVHSTGAKKRLDRKFGRKGTADYAKEELVAEMGAVFLCAETGILFQTLNNSVAYLKGWNSRLVKNMEKDNRLFFRAASKAQEASDHILSLDSKGVPKYRNSKAVKNTTNNIKKNVARVTPKRKLSVSKSKIDKNQIALFGAIPKTAKGLAAIGGIDYFEYTDKQPKKVKDILKKHDLQSADVDVLKHLKNELTTIGWTFEYGKDAIPFFLRPAQKNVTSAKKKPAKKKGFASKLKSKLGLSAPIVLDGGTSLPSAQPKRAALNGDAAAPVLDMSVIAEPINKIQAFPDVTTKNKMPARAKSKGMKYGRKMNSVGRTNNESYNPVGSLAEILGGIEVKPKGSVVVTLDAEQGAGKTRMFFQAINAYANAQLDVSFFSFEEHPDSDLFTSKRDQYLNEYAKSTVTVISDDEFNQAVFDEVVNNSQIIFIDSFGKLLRLLKGLDLDEDMRKKYDGKIFFVIYQRTADGKMRGGSMSAFDADIVAKMEKDLIGRNHKMYFNKNRYEKVPGLKYNINTQEVERSREEIGEMNPIVLN